MRSLTAVFDIDGVLADVRHRLVHVADGRRDWPAFFAAAPADPPLAAGLALVHRSAQDCAIVFLTGRPERCRADTLAWLERQGLPVGRLLMRQDGDRRPARAVKLDVLAQLRQETTVAVVVDDDEAVCAACKDAGLPVLRADWMPAGGELRTAQEVEGRT